MLQGTGGSLLLEVSEFGWWFIERRIPRDWALAQLREVLQAGVVAEPSHKVMEAMALDAADSLEQVMEGLELFLKTAQTPWAIRSWRKEIREIIGLARVEETAPMRQKTAELVSRLTAGGIVSIPRSTYDRTRFRPNRPRSRARCVRGDGCGSLLRACRFSFVCW